MTEIGFVGLGAMGGAMAGRLAAAGEHAIAAFDLDRSRVDAVVAAGASRPASAALAAVDADVLMLMVATGEQLEEALFGREGAARSLRPGATVVVFSTIGPDAAIATARRLAEQDVATLDAPVSGGPVRAAAGELLIMVGGDSSVLARLRPVLAQIGSSVVHCGERVGDGQAVKLVNQLLCGIHIAAAAEAVAFAESLSIDPRMVLDAVGRGAAQSFMLDDRGSRMVEGAFVPARSALDIFVKDLGLVGDAAAEAGFAARLAEHARTLFEEGSARGLGSEDDAGVVRVLRGVTT